MAEILLVNPRKRSSNRRKKVATRKKRRTPAQKRATAKMIAANRRRKSSTKRRKNPVKRKPTVRRRRRTTAVKRRRTRRRSNPSLSVNSVKNQLMEAGTGAVGALGLDVIQGYLPIPANLKTGFIGTGVKALLAIGMGIAATKIKVVRPATAAKMANGALTVVLHDELRKQVGNFAPGIAMGEYLTDDNLGYGGSGLVVGDMSNGMGVYLPDVFNEGGMEQEGLGMYESDYIEDMQY